MNPDKPFQRFILASASPRRKELLSLLGIPFQVYASHVDESLEGTHSPSEAAQILAQKKAIDVSAKFLRQDLIIGSDTIVESPDGEALGKPADAADALRMLQLLSGRTHSVHTGVALVRGEDGHLIASFTESTKVFMNEIPEALLRAYIRSGEPFDKAGAYGIQGIAALFMNRIEGDFYSVVGLPVAALATRLNSLGIALLSLPK